MPNGLDVIAVNSYMLLKTSDPHPVRHDGAIKSRAIAARLLSRRTRRTAFSGFGSDRTLRDDQCKFAFGKLLTFFSNSSFAEAVI
ncbi:MAG: hypothetical protein KAZ87_01610 [Spirochaetes bacterium]|nr:hypothetical protein [Spirochaetota bacterium]